MHWPMSCRTSEELGGREVDWVQPGWPSTNFAGESVAEKVRRTSRGIYKSQEPFQISLALNIRVVARWTRHCDTKIVRKLGHKT